MKIHCAAILALASITADAFSTSHSTTHSTRLFSTEEGALEEGGDPLEPASGSAKFKQLLEAAKSRGGGGGPAVANPFLSAPAPAAPAAVPAGVNLENMSVEQQAALLRQLLGGGGASAPADPYSTTSARKEKGGMRPVGRNKDADTISNTADVYFAQLKRDSTVRTLARQRGEEDVAEAVFEDEGIRELNNLLVENPYLKGQKQEESTFFEAIPEESLGPFIYAAHSEEKQPINVSGPKYKEILKKKRSKDQDEAPPAATVAPVVETPAPPAPVQAAPQPEVTQVVAATPPPAAVAPQPKPVEIPRPAQPTVTSYTDDARQKLRTFMGLLLKHRGGPGFGKGRLQGQDIDRFESMLEEIMAMLREEAMQAAPTQVPMMTAPVAAAPAPVTPAAAVAPAAPQPAAASAGTSLAKVDGAVACIEGATMMYKNSPAQLRESLLGALRAALLGAVNTCSQAAAMPQVTAEEIGSSGAGGINQIDGVIACIDGAVIMYKNSPDTVKPAMIVALRAALVSAIGMCNSVIDGAVVGAAPPAASVSPVPTIETPPPQPQTVASSATATAPPVTRPEVPAAAPATPEPKVVVNSVTPPPEDGNSKKLKQIYDQLKAASGKGSLGIRSDLTASEASDLADSLVEMRSLLMKELNEGIPELGEAQERPKQTVVIKATAPTADKSSAASRYKEMLAKARAEKEGNAVAN